MLVFLLDLLSNGFKCVIGTLSQISYLPLKRIHNYLHRIIVNTLAALLPVILILIKHCKVHVMRLIQLPLYLA